MQAGVVGTVGGLVRGTQQLSAAIGPVRPALDLPKAAAASGLRVGTFNVKDFYDTVKDPAQNDGQVVMTPQQYRTKLGKLALAIRDQLKGPDILALEEIENQRVLDDLVSRPEIKDLGYKVVIRPTNDLRGISVAMIYRDSAVSLAGVEQPNPVAKLPDSASGQVDPSLLFARPPLIVDFQLRGAAQAAEGAAQIEVIVNHFKSKIGGSFLEPRREAQGAYIGGLVDARRATNPTRPVLVVGDFNAGYTDGAYRKIAQRADGSARMTDAPMKLPEGDRYTYIYKGRKDMLDHMLLTPDAQAALTSVEIRHFDTADGAKHAGDPKVPNGVSDHDPIVATFNLAALLRARS